jgi:hypothetical protein
MSLRAFFHEVICLHHGFVANLVENCMGRSPLAASIDLNSVGSFELRPSGQNPCSIGFHLPEQPARTSTVRPKSYRLLRTQSLRTHIEMALFICSQSSLTTHEIIAIRLNYKTAPLLCQADSAAFAEKDSLPQTCMQLHYRYDMQCQDTAGILLIAGSKPSQTANNTL